MDNSLYEMCLLGIVVHVAVFIKRNVQDNQIENNLTRLIEAICKLEETFGVTLTLMILLLNEEGKFV